MKPDKLTEDITILKTMVSEIHADTKKLISAVYDKEGLISQTALNKAAIKRVWGIVVLLLSGLTGLCFFVLRGL